MADDKGPPPVDRFDSDSIFDEAPRNEDYGAASGLPEYPEVGNPEPPPRKLSRSTIPADRSGLAQAEGAEGTTPVPVPAKPFLGITNWWPIAAVSAGLVLLWLNRKG